MFKRTFLSIILTLSLVCLICSCGHTHEWSEWQITKEATCSTTGTNTRICNSCNETQTTILGLKEHSWGEWTTETAPTCTAEGKDIQRCASCGQVNEKQTEKIQHSLNENDICVLCNKQFISMSESEKNIASQIYYISNRHLLFNCAEAQYEFTFELKNKNEKKIVAPCLVDIRMEDSNGNIIYQKTTTVRASNYIGYTATISIPESEINTSYTGSPTLYYKVYNPGYFNFSEFSLSTIKLNLPNLPYTYTGRLNNYVTNIKYEYVDNSMFLYISGSTLSGGSTTAANSIFYKIYDSDGAVVKSYVFAIDARQGEKFKDVESFIYGDNIIAGETYSLAFYY